MSATAQQVHEPAATPTMLKEYNRQINQVTTKLQNAPTSPQVSEAIEGLRNLRREIENDQKGDSSA